MTIRELCAELGERQPVKPSHFVRLCEPMRAETMQPLSKTKRTTADGRGTITTRVYPNGSASFTLVRDVVR